MKKSFLYLLHLDHWLITVFTFIILGLLYSIFTGLSFFSPVKRTLSDMSSTDLFFHIANKTSQINQDITIVDINGEYNRGNIAKCITDVDSLKPWIIGVDIIFEGIKGDTDNNMYLLQTADQVNSKVVWAAKLLDYVQENKSFSNQSNSFFVDSLSVETGFTNLNDNLNRTTIREMLIAEKCNGNIMYSFPMAIAISLGDSLSIKPGNKLFIDYSSRFAIVPYDSLDFYKELITNHIVLIGSTTDESDMWHTPLGKVPGVMIQAYSLNTLRNHSDIKYFSIWKNLLVAFVICYLFELLIDLGFQRLRKLNNAFSIFLLESKLLLRVVTFLWMALVTWVVLLVFIYHSQYYNAILILAAIGLLIESRRIYSATIKALSKNHNWWILKNSIFYKQ